MIIAILPLKEKSERVKGKNLRPFYDYQSLAYIKMQQLIQLRNARVINEIVVNTSSDQIEKWAANFGVTVHRRDPYYDSCSGSEYFAELARQCPEDSTLIYAPCTSPLLEYSTLGHAIALYLNDGSHDSVIACLEHKEFLWYLGEPVNYDPKKAPNSQDLPPFRTICFAFGILQRETMIERKNIIGDHPCLWPLDHIEGFDIDTELDFEIAQFIYQNRRKS